MPLELTSSREAAHEPSNHKILHINIQCLRNKVEEFELRLLDLLPDFICVCEHWLIQSEIEILKIENYELVTNFSRQNYIHGGVAMDMGDHGTMLLSCKKSIYCLWKRFLNVVLLNVNQLIL